MTVEEEAAKAFDMGLLRFLSEKPCANGHHLRYSHPGSKGRCVICSQVRDRNRYHIAKQDPEHMEKLRLKSEKYRRNNPEKATALVRKWQARNPDKMRAYNKKYYQRKKDRSLN